MDWNGPFLVFSGVLISLPHNPVGLWQTPTDWQAKSDIKSPKPPDCQSGGVRWSPVQLPSPLESSSSQSTRLQWSPVESGGVRWTLTGLCQYLMESGWVQWSPAQSGGLQLDSASFWLESGGVRWSPPESNWTWPASQSLDESGGLHRTHPVLYNHINI